MDEQSLCIGWTTQEPSMRAMVRIIVCVLVLSGTLTAPAAMAGHHSRPTATDTVEVERIYGADRYETAVDVSQEIVSYSPTEPPPPEHRSYEVVVASGGNWPDALVAAPLADGARGRPLLLVRGGSVPAVVEQELLRIETKHVLIVGGTGAVSAEVEESLRQLPTVEGVERIGGRDRYETASLVAERLTETGLQTEIWLATGRAFPDALAASAEAGIGGTRPILLVDGDTIPQVTRHTLDELNRQNLDTVFIAGGEGAVGPSVVEELKTMFAEERIFRFGGADRYETALAISRAWVDGSPRFHWFAPHVASGQDFPDALTGSVRAAGKSAPILLTDPDVLPGPTAQQLRKSRYLHSVTILGGPGAVSPAVEEAIRSDVQ